MIEQITKADLDDALAKHANDEMPRIKEMVDNAIGDAKKQLLHAFPDGIENHREAHERMIAAARAEEAFWHDLKTDIAKKSIWGILHILFLLTIGTLAVKLGVGSVLGIGK
jgi:hypothetical protein